MFTYGSFNRTLVRSFRIEETTAVHGGFPVFSTLFAEAAVSLCVGLAQSCNTAYVVLLPQRGMQKNYG